MGEYKESLVAALLDWVFEVAGADVTPFPLSY